MKKRTGMPPRGRGVSCALAQKCCSGKKGGMRACTQTPNKASWRQRGPEGERGRARPCPRRGVSGTTREHAAFTCNRDVTGVGRSKAEDYWPVLPETSSLDFLLLWLPTRSATSSIADVRCQGSCKTPIMGMVLRRDEKKAARKSICGHRECTVASAKPRYPRHALEYTWFAHAKRHSAGT